MKAGKIIGGVVIAVIAVLAVVIFLGLQNLDQIVKLAVEKVGTQVTGTAVSLDEVKIQLSDGRGELYGLQIDNPPGYNSPYAFYLGAVALQVQPKSLTTDVIVIEEILVDGAILIAEQKGLKDTNLQDLMDNMSAGQGGASEPEPADANSSSVKLIIEKISFANNDAKLITQQWGEKSLSLPDINLVDIGKKENGLTPEQMGPAIIEPLLKQAKRAVKNELEKLAKEAATQELEKQMNDRLNDKQKGQVESLKKLFN